MIVPYGIPSQKNQAKEGLTLCLKLEAASFAAIAAAADFRGSSSKQEEDLPVKDSSLMYITRTNCSLSRPLAGVSGVKVEGASA